MEVLSALGVNETVGIQFVIFVLVYLVLSRLVFIPYYQAYAERTRRTVGNTDAAEQLLAQAEALEIRYQDEAKALNQKSKVLFENARKAAQVEYQKIIETSRQQSKAIMEQTHQKISAEVQRVQPQVKAEVLTVSSGIVSKLLGKDLAV